MAQEDTLIVKMLPTLPPRWLVPEKKIIQFDILVFLEAQEINYSGTLKANIINTLHFYGVYHVLKTIFRILNLSVNQMKLCIRFVCNRKQNIRKLKTVSTVTGI